MNRNEVIEFGREVLLTEARGGKLFDATQVVALFHPELEGDREALEAQSRIYARQLEALLEEQKIVLGKQDYLGAKRFTLILY